MESTIYTVGYRGRSPEELIELLKRHGIKVLVDVRHGKRARKGFSPTDLRKRLEEHDMIYISMPSLGVSRIVREPYLEGRLSFECFRQWYLWWIEKNRRVWEDAIRKIKGIGAVAIMCAERYPKPRGEQRHYCHRDILADYLIQQGFFEDRFDIE
jgi:ParB family chromosome partitioning protein